MKKYEQPNIHQDSKNKLVGKFIWDSTWAGKVGKGEEKDLEGNGGR